MPALLRSACTLQSPPRVEAADVRCSGVSLPSRKVTGSGPCKRVSFPKICPALLSTRRLDSELLVGEIGLRSCRECGATQCCWNDAASWWGPNNCRYLVQKNRVEQRWILPSVKRFKRNSAVVTLA